MRLASVRGPSHPAPAVLLDAGTYVDVASAFPADGWSHDMRLLIERWSEAAAPLAAIVRNPPADAVRSLADARLAPPVPRPGKIVCLAGNYREHIVESGFRAVDASDVITPQLFLKPATALSGDGDAIPLRPGNRRVGWEAELAVVIGAAGRDIPEADAMSHVFGYTVLNDVSERAFNADVPNRRLREMDRFLDWLAGKWFDGFAPCGPWLVTADEIPDPHALDITLEVNGATRQSGTTAAMIFRIPALVSAISTVMTLEPGDLISTGTPAGAGTGAGNAWLTSGDEVVCRISGIGELRNRARAIG